MGTTEQTIDDDKQSPTINHEKDEGNWRQEEDSSSLAISTSAAASVGKSHGISPSVFYNNSPYKRDRALLANAKSKKDDLPEKLRDLPQRIENKLLCEEKRKHLAQLSCRREVFKDFTALKMWPTQSMALEHLDRLLGKNENENDRALDSPCSDCSTSTFGSQASTEAKRMMRDASSSPAESQDRQRFHNEFLIQSQSSDTVDVEPLWSMEPRIFSIEKANGKRKYVVGHFGRIADFYWRKMCSKHLYELVREGSPCRLYFDIEFAKEFNPDIDEEACEVLLKEFREELFHELETVFDIKDLADNMIMDLDSSSKTKFSRHWMLNLPKLFKDAPAVGRFVKRFIGRLASEVATQTINDKRPTLAKYLFVNTKDPEKQTCFVDLGVYTRNRLFRVLGSSKFGKDAVLTVADSNTYPRIQLPRPKPPSDTSTLDDCKAANEWTTHARCLAETLVVPLGDLSAAEIYDVPDDFDGADSMAKIKRTTASGKPQQVRLQKIFHPRKAHTPLPKLDSYVLDVLACRGGTSGSIRVWSMATDERNAPISITYQLVRNRYCELVGREHKSNNVYWTIDFKTWSCIQACHDPDCYGRGAPHAIPQTILDEIMVQYDAWQEEEFEKALLALNLNEADEAISKQSIQVREETGNQNTQSDVDEIPLTIENDKSQDNGTSSLSDEALLEAMFANPEQFP